MNPLDLKKWTGFKLSSPDSIIDQIVIDSRLVNSSQCLFIALNGKHVDGHQFVQDAFSKGAKFAIVSKEYESPKEYTEKIIRVNDPLRALQEIALAYRKELKAHVIGITGTHGKTMVKDFLACLLKGKKQVAYSPESFNSQIGVPLSLLQIKSHHEVALIEAGISEEGEMDFLADMIQPDHAIFTVLADSPHPSLNSKEKIAREKSKLLKAVPSHKWCLLPNDPELFHEGKKYHWNEHCDMLPKVRLMEQQKPFQTHYELQFPGGKNVQGVIHQSSFYLIDLLNIGIKAAYLLGLTEDEITDGLTNYTPEPMQTEIWKASMGTTFINDAYCADPMSVEAALKKLSYLSSGGKKFFIFGGLRDNESSASTKKIEGVIKNARVDEVIRIPKDFETEEKALLALMPKLQRDDCVLIQGPKKKHFETLMNTLEDMVSHNNLSIDLSAILSNLQWIQDQNRSVNRIMVMLKANGYGTDSVILAKYLAQHGINIIGVAHPDEGISLKRSGVMQTIFVINCALFEVKKIVKNHFEIGVSSEELIDALEEEALKQNVKIKVHLHVDTGMSRLGCRPSKALQLAKRIKSSPSLLLEGLMTHFACADMEEEDDFTKSQVERFRRVIESLKVDGIYPQWIHASNSSGTLRAFFPEGNMIRLGLAIFGLHGCNATRAYPLKPALKLTSRIVGINICKEGDTVSYGRTYQTSKEEERIAVIPLGYFDGLHRKFSGMGHVVINGQIAPMVGTICMDFMMVNVTHIKEVKVGDPVLIFGQDATGIIHPPETFASSAASSVYELITCLGPRIQRVFTENEH